MFINERPNIVATVNTEDGYLVRTLCLVDGLPAQIEIEVDTHRQKYSSYAIHVYNAQRMEWSQRVHSLRPNEVGRMPILGDDAETLVALNHVADLLWQGANLIVRTARQRIDELDAAKYGPSTADTCHSDHGDISRSMSSEQGWVHPFASDADPLACGDHDETGRAADSEEVQP